ncbi:MAG TPA: phosphoribosylanthranilate isomerase [Vicinamibacterales bacterium]|jgi:phosphoribosylanthranilate isomerase|nr:phosphoribosylanthranilate isomerase [Vicinamibacterales bacterium]
MTFVKVCGITRVDDARVAVNEGASAIGFVFWPKSPRYVAPERAREIVERLPVPAIPVGVFVNQSCDEVNAIARTVGLGAVQLHGDETVACAGGMDRPVIKALSAVALEQAESWPKGIMLLVDAHDAEKRGGTGVQADWAAAARLARRRRMMLAGGLNVENIAQAIRDVRPYGVDVSSGVEISPGIKDVRKIAALMRAIEAGER